MNIFGDIETQRWVQGVQNSGVINAQVLPIISHTDTVEVVFRALQPIVPAPNPFTPQNIYNTLDLSGVPATLYVLSSAGVELARLETWVLSEANRAMTGYIALNTAAMVTAFTAVLFGGSLDTVWSLRTIIGSRNVQLRQGGFPIYKSDVVNAVTAPVINPEYPSLAVLQAMFVRFTNNPLGATIDLSADAGGGMAHHRIIGVQSATDTNPGAGLDNYYTV